ncbi:MAG TPA: PAS domain S-box protein [Burkholderiaceae bacterium]|nr:PAS domain S-box protein [Burkholderiaceae bacterium]
MNQPFNNRRSGNRDRRNPAPSWRDWWKHQSPSRQDKLALIGPIASVLLFVMVMLFAFAYLRVEEIDRETEAVNRDVEYAQQRIRLRLLERQEQLMRIARQVINSDIDGAEFELQAENLINQYPELISVTWIDAQRQVVASHATPSAADSSQRKPGDIVPPGDTGGSFDLARDLRQPVYSNPLPHADQSATLMVQIPLTDVTRFNGVVMGEYSLDGLLRFGVPSEVMARYAVTLVTEDGRLLAGTALTHSPRTLPSIPGLTHNFEQDIPVSPVGNSLVLKAQGYRTSKDLVGGSFMWLMGGLSALTVWMLIGNWRHTRRRVQAQQALLAETNFRRAMENSMLTGMRALDMHGRISYVNPAFCSMTGWTEAELVGQTAPFPYWADEDKDILMARLEDELSGRSNPGGFEMRVKKRNGQVFDARMYVSPLIDPNGVQKGWMTSMTDITEPKRIRQELTASYERFTTVLESLDSAVSVVPLGSDELLFANKLYRLWFGMDGKGHQQLVAQCGPAGSQSPDDGDQIDVFAGLPIQTMTDAQAENAELYLDDLDKWLEIRSRYVTWVDGRLAQIAIATDITPRRLAEEQAARQAERAQTASRLITMGEMASSVAHELNQPLTAISNYCSGMITRVQKHSIDEPDLLAALDKTARQAQRAGQIVQRIKSFVKRSEPNPTLSDVATMVNNAIELADIELRRQQVRLTHYVAARMPPLVVDPILIEQVLINLLKNGAESIIQAKRAVEERQIELKALPRRINDAEVIEFSVRDTGSGVPAELLERIYEAFYSTKAEGMGIGLKLCRSIIESHHGRIQVENIYNGADIVGCVFSFWIPVQSPLKPSGT